MKDQILKIAKVKSEKEFYKKYPTEEAFMKAHGKAFKKAAMGAKMVNDQLHQLTDFGNPPIAQDGFHFADALSDAKQNLAKSQQEPEPDKPGTLDSILSVAGQLGEMGGAAAMRRGGYMSKYQDGGGLFNIANAINKSFVTPGKPATDTSAGTPASGGLGDFVGNVFNGKSGGAKGIMDASQKMFTGEGGLMGGIKQLGTKSGLATAGKAAGLGLLNSASDIIGGFGQMNEQKKAIDKAHQQAEISGVTALAAESQPERKQNKYVRPEDSLVQPGQMNSPQGTGTNYLAQNGAEIQNTYAPGNLYGDLGYEPLNDSNPKQYAYGGHLHKASFGDYFQSSGQASIGKGVGSAVGSVFGPLGSMAGGFIGSALGNVFGGADDATKLKGYQDVTKANTERSAFAQGANSLHAQNASFMRDGGYTDSEHAWVSNGWQPQVITKFGEHSVKDLLQPPHDADMLRAGGHLSEYTPPSAEAMYTGRSQYAMGGDLEVHRGKAETMSYNPYLPDGGETVMFRGPSHDNGGMPVSYGENGVEVEGGEPAVKLQDGGNAGDSNLVVFGNMVIPDYGVKELGDKNAKGKKFKHYVADLSKKEAKHNKTIEKAIDLVNDANTNNVFDQLSLNAGKAMLMGSNLKLKDIADKKQKAAMVQNAILDTAEEFGIESDGLAKGKIRAIKDPAIGRDGKMLSKAQNGSVVDYLKKAGKKTDFASRKELAKSLGITNYSGTAEQNKNLLGKLNKATTTTAAAPVNETPSYVKVGPAPQLFPIQPEDVPVEGGRHYDFAGNYYDDNGNFVDQGGGDLPNSPVGEILTKGKNKNKNKTDWKGVAETIMAGAMPLFRPTNQEGLDPSQLMGEYYALGNNQLEGVQAQTFQPMLDNAYDISLQDQVNAIDSQARAAIRAAGQDPAAQAYIMAQAADQKNKVLGEQFRINQANKAQTYQANRQALNQAQLQNLGILDKQYERQATAKSKTKAEAIGALQSIAAKMAQNKLENRQLGIYENMYKYRFGPQGQAINYNDPAQFNPYGNPTASSSAASPYPGYKVQMEPKLVKEKSGGKIASRNGSIVKAVKLKNI